MSIRNDRNYINNKNATDKKSEQLGMSYGKARNILNNEIMFMLVKKLGLNVCYRCGKKIKSSKDLSIEHMKSWLDSEDPKKLFFDLDNISFSHLSCNSAASSGGGTKPVSINCRIGKAGYKGVNFVSPHSSHYGKYKYDCNIYYNGKHRFIGRSDDARELALKYDEKAIELLGEDAITNKKLGLL